MMEVTRALGQLKREGIRPKRTLVFCSWDGEEVTLTGSTEWGEQFAAELKREAGRLPQRGLGRLGPAPGAVAPWGRSRPWWWS